MQYYRAPLRPYEIDMLRQKTRAQSQAQIAYLESLLPENKIETALDYGAADGELGKALNAKAKTVYVAELDSQYTELLKKETEIIFVDEETLDSSEFNAFFDLVTLSHVLEHLMDPLAALDRFSRLLKKNGFLLVDLPNEVEMLRKADFQANGHLHYFTPECFQAMVTRHGKFEILEMRTCNHPVEEFMESGFTLPEQHFRFNTPNGTVIRSLLKNTRPNSAGKEHPSDTVNDRLLLDEYSRRMVHMYQQLLTTQKQKQQIELKCKDLLVENENLSETLKHDSDSSMRQSRNADSQRRSPDPVNRLKRFLQKIRADIYPEPPSETHQHITRQMLNRLLQNYIFAEKCKVLDVGCGQGLSLELFRNAGFNPAGITLDNEDLAACRLKDQTVFKMDQSLLEFNDETFDLIWCRHCLEHSVIPYFTLSEFFRVLKPMGYAYIEVPAPDTASNHQKNKNHYSVLGKSMWGALIRRTGFDILETLDISLNVPSGADIYWAFIQQKPFESRNNKQPL